MSQVPDVFGESYRASIQARLVGPWGGLKPPRPMSGQYVFPYGQNEQSTGPLIVDATVTANRAYYAPFPIYETTTFTGAALFVSSTHAALNARMCLAAEAATGGPGALIKDFGAVVLSTLGLYGFNSTIIVPGPRMAYIGCVFDSNVIVRAMQPFQYLTAAGLPYAPEAFSVMPRFTAPGTNGLGYITPIGSYGAFTLGAWADPVAAPTADIVSIGHATAGNLPLMVLKV